jgi:outer membrane biosynthesis protein TonB
VAALKWVVVALCGLGALSALGMGFTSLGATRKPVLTSAVPLSLRAFPDGAVAVAARAPDAEPTKSPEPVADKEPAKTPEPVAAKTPDAAKPADTAKPAVVAAKTPDAAAKPAEAAKPAVAAPPPVADGMLNLRASDTADVYLDGRKLGGSPLLGVKAKAGNHKVRFDCYDAAGNTMTGAAQSVTVKPEAETEVDFTCPAE